MNLAFVDEADEQKTPITLYTAATPNGFKVSIALEEFKSQYGLSYNTKPIAFSTNEQKSDWFVKLNPNGRIPTIVDHTAEDLAVYETGAILLYLADKYDKDHVFSFTDPKEKAEVLSTIFFAHGGIGPMQGQANHFFRYAPEKVPYGIARYQQETSRLYSVLNNILEGKDYLVGAGKGKYSIADMNAFPWVRSHDWAGVSIEEYPNIGPWLARIEARPAVAAGLNVPPPKKQTEAERLEEAKKWIGGPNVPK